MDEGIQELLESSSRIHSSIMDEKQPQTIQVPKQAVSALVSADWENPLSFIENPTPDFHRPDCFGTLEFTD